MSRTALTRFSRASTYPLKPDPRQVRVSMGTGHRFSETHNLIKKTYVIHYGSSGVKALYYNGPDELKDEEHEAVILNARTLAEARNGLAMIVNTSCM